MEYYLTFDIGENKNVGFNTEISVIDDNRHNDPGYDVSQIVKLEYLIAELILLQQLGSDNYLRVTRKNAIIR